MQSYRAKTALQRICGAIAKSQIQRRLALFIAQSCSAKNSRRSGVIAKPTLNMGQQQLPRKNSAAKNFRRSGAITKPKIQHKSATITAQSNAARNLRRIGAIAKPKMKQGSATITTLTKVRNPRKIRVAAQYVYNPPPYSTVTGLRTILFQFTILVSLGQLAQLGQGGWASCCESERLKELIFYLKRMVLTTSLVPDFYTYIC